jgi:hypothetical protein
MFEQRRFIEARWLLLTYIHPMADLTLDCWLMRIFLLWMGRAVGTMSFPEAVQIGDAWRCLVILQAFYRAAYYTDEKAF